MHALSWIAVLSLAAQSPTRADLAAAYLRFERLLRDHPPTESVRVEVERGFDAATLEFFTGAGTRALEQIDGLSARLDPDRAKNPAERLADALALDFEPRQVVSSTGGTVNFRLRTLRSVDALEALGTGERTATVRVVLPTDSGRRILAQDVFDTSFATGSGTQPVAVRVPAEVEFPAARIDLDVELEVSGAAPRRVGTIALMGTPLEVVRGEIEGRLARIEPDGPPLEQSLAACRARAALLDASSSATDSSRFLLDLAAHAADVEREAHELSAGRDPYRRRAGDLWRVIRTESGATFPVRVYAPESACTDARVPLVIALHGAGGDENMFLDAYGLGRLRSLAREHGFLVVCPRLGFGGLSPQAFDALLLAMIYTHAVDTQRVHIIGHSMGAGAAGALRLARGARIASTALLAGAPRLGGDANSPPLYIVGGELDPLAGAASLRRAAESARTEGAAVELRILPGRGHTLFVGDVLPDVLAWCLARSRK